MPRPGDVVREKRCGKVEEIGYSGNVYVRWDDGRDDWMRPSQLAVVEGEEARLREEVRTLGLLAKALADARDQLVARLALADAAHEAFDEYQDAADDDPEVLPITKPGHIPLPPSTAAWRKFCDAKNAWRAQRTTSATPVHSAKGESK